MARENNVKFFHSPNRTPSNGSMVELLHDDMARRTLAIADAIAERSLAAE